MPELILLGDQATNCLSAAHSSCPRFRASRHRGEADGAFVPFFATAEEAWQQDGPLAGGIAGLGALDGLGGAGSAQAPGRARWGRLGAALIFLSVLLCGSFTAVYTGWDWITRDLRVQTAAGRVDMAGVENASSAAAQSAQTPAIYVVMTATPVQVAAAAPFTSSGVSAGIIPVLPAAVTPTPIRVELAAPGVITAEAGAASPGEPPIDVDLLVPTRRPTPVFDVPTSTPLAEETPTPGATDTPTIAPTPLGTPIVLFAPVEKELERGECTMVRWNVQNVREVYYENLPMNGQGEREECIKDEDETYTLLVVLGDGSPQIYTTTVSYLPPTPTPTNTPVFTPEPVHTPTWTPEPPTPTAPPNLFYAVNMAVNGSSEISCGAGQTCEVGLLVTNGGSGVDNVSVVLLASDGFTPVLCRPDGVCGAGSVPINNMGPGNTAYVVARFSVPGDAPSQTRVTATFQARSDGSGGGVTSAQVGVTVVVP